MEQSFALEQQEISISQLQGRLRDLAAYQTVLASASGAPSHSPPPQPSRGGGARGRGGGSGGGGGGGSGGAGREELNAVVERMTRVIERLQAENVALQKKAVSNVRYMELQKESKELRQQLEAAAQEKRQAEARAAALREEADRADN